ncbi:heavy metal-associated isoprenylated plant protein 41-like [Nymphaea colorata]|nr:heavy metal-associated isoprenylated plant protein 41-like [Nymphaea colorata]
MNFKNEHEILLVGEGDFSFSHSVAKKLGSARKMTATSLDSREELKKMYGDAQQNLEQLARMGCLLLHGMDATTMSAREELRDRRFDRIVFNNPRVRTVGLDHDKKQIKENSKLMEEFFENASGLLSPGGEVYVSMKTCAPYNEWKVVRQAAKSGLFLADKCEFKISEFPGYTNRKGRGKSCNKTFPLDSCCTFVFKHLLYL